ncbi:MAG: STAS domain-containing protein [Solirubrobacteraceae bacterium]
MPSPIDLPTPSAHPSLEVSHRDCGDSVCVATPAGEIDLATAPLLKSRLVALLGEGFDRFVVDLSEVRYLDSTGLGVLIAFSRRLTDEGAIVLAQPPASVSALLEITGLDATFQVFATADEAVAHVRGDRAGAVAQPAFGSDAAVVVGLAATALPFAESAADELRRWIRILSIQGEAGRALQRVGLTDGAAELPAAPAGDPVGPESHADSVTRVTRAATAIAADREAGTVSTVDLLLAVMLVYGDAFDQELHVHGTSSTELIECLGTGADPAGVS